MSMFDTTALSVAGVAADSPVAAAALTRSGIFDMSQAAETAVLAPREAGAWSHELRAALAARIAWLNGDSALSDHYRARAGDMVALADPEAGTFPPDLAPVIAFMDKVAQQTGRVVAGDIAALQAANVSDADIVRLAELNAFISYQVRVMAGLRLLNRSDR
ncbi:MAG: hypothetical protein OEY05_07175 [Paracoccaceae bacterium]|nr:hypothetical protein [Paracoccaceae bacterium]